MKHWKYFLFLEETLLQFSHIKNSFETNFHKTQKDVIYFVNYSLVFNTIVFT